MDCNGVPINGRSPPPGKFPSLPSSNDAGNWHFQISSIRFDAKSFREFESKHLIWVAVQDLSDPIYCLPSATVDVLSKPSGKGRIFLDESQARAEHDFADLCDDWHAVGVWDSHFIKYPPLRPAAAPLPGDFGLPKGTMFVVERLVSQTGDFWHRMKGYAGRLVVDPEFNNQRNRLSQLWNQLPTAARPFFPLHRSIYVPSLTALPEDVAARATSVLSEFQRHLDEMLTHFQLTALTTWDLPLPQGPMIPAVVGWDSPAMPKHSANIVWPAHLPIRTQDDLHREVRRQQSQICNELGLDPELAGLSNCEAYARMFDVHHLELTICSRYRRTAQRGGFMTALEHSIAEGLELEVSYVQKLRKLASSVRRGKHP